MEKVMVNGQAVDFDAAVNLMDSDIRDEINARGIDDKQAFVDAYAVAHAETFGETWVVA